MFKKILKYLTDEIGTSEPELVLKTPVSSNDSEEPKIIKQRRKSTKKTEDSIVELTPKEIATAAGEPYVAIISVDLDPNDINNGSFELDWNDKFILNLIRHGYKHKAEDTDAVLVDRWFTAVCRNVVLEVYEQYEADPDHRPAAVEPRNVVHKDLGGGRTEIS